MSDYSKPPEEALRDAQGRGYTGIHLEQGVPILDRDLNLMHDLLASGLQSMLSRYIGDGLPASAGDGFAIRALPDASGLTENNFQIVGPGACLVGGTEATITDSVDYNHQPNVASLAADHPSLPLPLTTPPAGGGDARHDIVFLDVFTTEVGGTPDLDNSADVGMQTSVRIKPVWIARVLENADSPPDPPSGHVHYPLARLLRRSGQAKIADVAPADAQPPTQIIDLRRRRLTVASLEARMSMLENVLFAPSLLRGGGQVTPLVGRINAIVTLNGRNLNKGAIKVTFDGVAADIVTATQSDTKLEVKVPGGVTLDGTAKNVKIAVSNEIGNVVSDRNFGVMPAPVFTAPEFSPKSGPPGTPVTLSGFNFTPGAPTVTFGGKVAVVQADATTYTTLKVTVPDGVRDDVTIKVAFPDPRGSSESATSFKVTAN
jgi:hypothetical protein